MNKFVRGLAAASAACLLAVVGACSNGSSSTEGTDPGSVQGQQVFEEEHNHG